MATALALPALRALNVALSQAVSYGVLGLALILALSAVVIAVAPDRAGHQRRVLKDLLGAADREGHALFASGPSVEEAEDWVTRLHNLVKDALGEGEAQRLLSDAGYVFYSSQHDTRQKHWIEGRLRRLAELIPRVDSLSVLSKFKPKTWAGVFDAT